MESTHTRTRGRPPRAGINPLLANIFLHYALDLRRRTALERINARLDRSFEFEQPFIRGLSRICPWSLGPTRCYASLTEGLVRLLGVSDRSLLLSPPLRWCFEC